MLRCFYGGPTEKETELRIIKEVFLARRPMGKLTKDFTVNDCSSVMHWLSLLTS